jgi:hypothetical protein
MQDAQKGVPTRPQGCGSCNVHLAYVARRRTTENDAGAILSVLLCAHLPGCQILHLLFRQRINLHSHAGEFETGDFFVDH